MSCKSISDTRAPCRSPSWSVFALCACLCRSAPAFEVFEGFQVHGFISQGYVLTSNNNLFGSSERGGSLDFTEIGVNASWALLPNLQLATQFVSRRAGESAESEPEFDFGLLDYAAVATAEHTLGVRLGRVRFPLGLYNDTRDVAFTRPSILLPQSIYVERTRALALSADGVLLYGEERRSWGNLGLELSAVVPRVDNDDVERTFVREGLPGELDANWSFVGRLIYDTPGQALRFAVTGTSVETDYRPRFAAPEDLGPGTDLFELVVLSGQYNAEHWSLTGEYSRRFLLDEGFGPFFDQDIEGEGYYIQGIYRLDPHWEFVARYDVVYNNVDDRDGTEVKATAASLGFDIPAHTQFAKDWTVGVRYNITPMLSTRAEYHNVYGTFWLFPQDNPNLLATEKKWDIFLLQLSYRF